MVIKRREPIRKKRKKPHKKAPNQFSAKGGIEVFRSGVEGGHWSLVDSDPIVRQDGDTISISANITVKEDATRQSAVIVNISEEALIAIFEKQFGIRSMSIGAIVSKIKMLRDST